LKQKLGINDIFTVDELFMWLHSSRLQINMGLDGSVWGGKVSLGRHVQ